MKLPLPHSLSSPTARSEFGWKVLRVVLALLIAAHGWARFVAGGVAPFGEFLDAQGFRVGFYLAAAITTFEIVGSLLLLAGRFVAPLCLAFSFVFAAGIALVHAEAGWFVVGLGRNGSEYSVLLIVCLWAVALQHIEPRKT